MNLHEYQAKQLFRDYGIAVPDGLVAHSPDEAVDAAVSLGGESWVVKAQIHAGARGKAGGVQRVEGREQLHSASEQLLSRPLATPQTHGRALPVNSLLVERPLAIERELYLGALLDRAAEDVVFMASVAGGMDIETVAATTPDKIISTHAGPTAGLQPFQCRQFAFALGLTGKQVGALTRLMTGLYRLFRDKDLSLVEINPLVVSADGELLALDGKVNVDDNAVYRHHDLAAMADPTQQDANEVAAARHDLNYVTLDGTIGCMVNGAGLAMATMDLVKLEGGSPANFLDVGGGTTAERVSEAFKLILSSDRVRAILVNIFGGIVRCDLIAEGIIAAFKQVGVEVPVIVRLEGTNAAGGLAMLDQSGLAIRTAASLTEAARLAVAAAR